jgi:hypothetical protein
MGGTSISDTENRFRGISNTDSEVFRIEMKFRKVSLKLVGLKNLLQDKNEEG